MVVVRQAVIDQHRLAAIAEHDAARLDVVMDHVLPVQICKRGRDLRDQQPRLLVRQRQVGQPLVECGPRNPLDHDVGLMGEIAGAEA